MVMPRVTDQQSTTEVVRDDVFGAVSTALGREPKTDTGGATADFNDAAARYGLPGISHLMTGAATLGRINAVIDAMNEETLGLDLYHSYVGDDPLFYGGPATDAHEDGVIVPDASGLYSSVAPGVLVRNDLGLWTVPTRTELGNRSDMAGAVVGVVGSGGALPTSWSLSAVTGLVVEVTEIGEEGDLPYVDILFSGQPSTNWRLRPSAAQGLTTVPGESYAASVFMALRDGALPQADDARFGPVWYNSGTGFLSSSYRDVAPLLTSELQRIEGVYLAPANADRSNLDMVFSVTASEEINFKLRFACPMMEQSLFAGPPVVNSASAPTTRDGNFPSVAVPSGARAFVLDVELLEPPAGSSARYLLNWSDGTQDNRYSLFVSSTGQVQIISVRDGVNGGSAGALAAQVGRNVIYGVVADGYQRRGIVGVGDSDAQASPAPNVVGLLGIGGYGYAPNANAFVRVSRLGELRDVSDPETAYQQVRTIAESWA